MSKRTIAEPQNSRENGEEILQTQSTHMKDDCKTTLERHLPNEAAQEKVESLRKAGRRLFWEAKQLEQELLARSPDRALLDAKRKYLLAAIRDMREQRYHLAPGVDVFLFDAFMEGAAVGLAMLCNADCRSGYKETFLDRWLSFSRTVAITSDHLNLTSADLLDP